MSLADAHSARFLGPGFIGPMRGILGVVLGIISCDSYEVNFLKGMTVSGFLSFQEFFSFVSIRSDTKNSRTIQICLRQIVGCGY